MTRNQVHAVVAACHTWSYSVQGYNMALDSFCAFNHVHTRAELGCLARGLYSMENYTMCMASLQGSYQMS